MTNEIRGFNSPLKPLAYNLLNEAITRAIGPNDPYPNDAQLAAHRTKQIRSERFTNIPSKEIAN